jgi:hypothetical protein
MYAELALQIIKRTISVHIIFFAYAQPTLKVIKLMISVRLKGRACA